MTLREISYAYSKGNDLSEINKMYKIAIENIDEEGKLEFWKHVCSYANVEMIKHFISIDWDPRRVEDDYKNNLLHFLADNNNSYKEKVKIHEATQVLLEAKVSPLRKNDRGETALMLAAKVGCFEMLAVYEENKKKTNLVDTKGNTLLHILAESSRSYVSNLSYAKKDLENNLNNTSFDINADYEVRRREELKLECESEQNNLNRLVTFAEMCLQFGHDPFVKNERNETAIDVAIRNKSKIIGALLNGADFNDNEKKALLINAGGQDIHQACLNNDLEGIIALIDLGAALNSEFDKEGHKFQGLLPLSIAMTNHNAECVDALLKGGAKSMLNDSKSWHPFRYLYSTESSIQTKSDDFKNKAFIKILKSFIEANYDINCLLDDDENTLLTLSAKYAGSLRMHNGDTIAKIIIDEAIYANADLDKTNIDGISALMYLCATSSERGESQLLTLLEEGASTKLKDKNGKTALMYAISNKDKTTAKAYCELIEQFGDLLINDKDNSEKSALEYAVEQNNENLVGWLLERQ